MKLFVSEFLCGGACAGGDLPESLLREGAAMWGAILADACCLDDVEVVTTRDSRLPEVSLPGVQILPVESASQERELFESLARWADSILLIAPELEGHLETRIAWLHEWGCGAGLSLYDPVSLTADKWRFAELCREQEFPHPPTWLLPAPVDEAPPSEPACGFPCIIKPRHGAGTTATHLVCNPQEWTKLWGEFRDQLLLPAVLQPWLPGLPYSIACLIDPRDEEQLWLPPGRQDFLGLQYQGGEIPVAEVDLPAVQKSVQRLLALLPGLRGYVGIDFLLSPDGHELTFLELNPRLTTAYLGYRELYPGKLLPWMLGHGNRVPILSPKQKVCFQADGRTSLVPLPE